MANFKNFICNIQNKLFLQIFVADAAEEVAKHFFQIRHPKTNLFKIVLYVEISNVMILN